MQKIQTSIQNIQNGENKKYSNYKIQTNTTMTTESRLVFCDPAMFLSLVTPVTWKSPVNRRLLNFSMCTEISTNKKVIAQECCVTNMTMPV